MRDRRRKVIFLEQYSKISGGQKMLLTVISGLDQQHYLPFVVLPDKGELFTELKRLGVGCWILPMGQYSMGNKNLVDIANYFIRMPFLVFFLKMIINKERIDLVYANGARTFVWGTIACALSGVPIVWHLHSIFDGGITKWLCVCFGKMSIVKRIVAVSDSTRRPLASLGKKIRTIYNGVDTERFHSLVGQRSQDNSVRKLTIIAGGLLVEWKNQEDLIKAASMFINKSNIPAEFLIVGGPLSENWRGEKYLRKLKKITKKFKLEKTVFFTGHFKEISSILQKADILVITSKRPDPCPLMMLEAMASGLAVIATNFGGPAEIIENNKDGLLYLSGDYQQLSKWLIYLAENNTRTLELGKRAQEKIAKRYSKKIFVSKINNLLDSLFL